MSSIVLKSSLGGGCCFSTFFWILEGSWIIRLWQSSASLSKKLIITTMNVDPLWPFSFGLQICHTSLTLSAWSIKIRAWSPIRLVGRLVPREISRKKKQDIYPSFTTLMRLCISSSTAFCWKKQCFSSKLPSPNRERERDMQMHKKISQSSQLVIGFHFGASFTNQLCLSTILSRTHRSHIAFASLGVRQLRSFCLNKTRLLLGGVGKPAETGPLCCSHLPLWEKLWQLVAIDMDILASKTILK